MSKYSLTSNNIYPPLPSVAEAVADKIKLVDEATDRFILAGFDFTWKGVDYHVSYRSDDQANFSAALNSANLSQAYGNMKPEERIAVYGENSPVPMPADWRMGWRLHPKDGSPAITEIFDMPGFLMLANAGAQHLQGLLSAGWEIKAQLAACATRKEVDAVASELGIEERLRQSRLLD